MDSGSGAAAQSQASLKSAKAHYAAPRLVTFGSVQKLTGWQRYPTWELIQFHDRWQGSQMVKWR